MQPRIMTVVGARPQFIKAAPVMRALAARGVDEVLVHTGQHFDESMSSVFFRDLELRPPHHHLGVAGTTHGRMTGQMLAELDAVLELELPELVLVYGDTNSTLAGALAAAKFDVPVVHVEAGLRSFDRSMPEELNRLLVDHLATVLACPTTTAVANLASEGITTGVHFVGDVMYDAALWARDRASSLPLLPGLEPGAYAVATVHRARATDERHELERVIEFLGRHAEAMPVVLPLHPRTRAAIERFGIQTGSLRVVEPMGYLEMARLVSSAALILTDSGGLQKEAYFHRVPCVTLRNTTEWVETIDAGWNRLWTTVDYARPRREIDDYGEGDAAERVADLVLEALDERPSRPPPLA